MRRYLTICLFIIAAAIALPVLVYGFLRISREISFSGKSVVYESNRKKAALVMTSTVLAATLGEATTSTTTKKSSKGIEVPPDLLPQEMPLIPGQEDKVKILLLGTDERSNQNGSRTDVIVLMIFDQNKGNINLISFPRDLYVRLPDGNLGRINTAFELGGFAGLKKTLERNFGLQADHYLLTNFAGFTKLINDLGGIDVKMGDNFSDWQKGEWKTYPSGINHLTGEEALWYVRSRETSNDLDRNRRAQEVVQALWRASLNLSNITRLTELYTDYRDLISTDFRWNDISDIWSAAVRMSENIKIKKYTFGVSEVVPWTLPTGAQVLLPKQTEINAILLKRFSK